MPERPEAETLTHFDLFQQLLAAMIKQTGNGHRLIAEARSMILGYFRDQGTRGLIPLDRQPTLEDKLPFSNLPAKIQNEFLEAATTGKPLSPESKEFLRGNFAVGQAAVRCILGASIQAQSTG